jgi:hypothetical protein
MSDHSIQEVAARQWGEAAFKSGAGTGTLIAKKGLCHEGGQRFNTSTKGWMQDYNKVRDDTQTKRNVLFGRKRHESVISDDPMSPDEKRLQQYSSKL